MARTVAGGNAADPIPQAPAGIDIENIPGEAQAQEAAPAQAPASGQGPYQYRPSEQTLRKLDDFKHWDEVKKLFGLDIEKLKKETNRYGVLEGLAYGSFTSQPIFLSIRMGNMKAIRDFFTVRLYTNPSNGEWGIETHKVNLKMKKDKETGEYVKKPDGSPAMTFDYNEIKEGDAIKFDGKYLSKEDVDHLRLTGTLGHAVTTVNLEGKATMTVLCPDPWNNHELIATSAETIKKRISTENGGVYVDKNAHLTFVPDKKQLGEIAIGQVVEVAAKEDSSKRAYLMYDTAAGKIRKTVSYEYALKRELARKEQEELGRKLAKEHVQKEKEGQSQSSSR